MIPSDTSIRRVSFAEARGSSAAALMEMVQVRTEAERSNRTSEQQDAELDDRARQARHVVDKTA